MKLAKRAIARALSLLLAYSVCTAGLPGTFAAQAPTREETARTGSIGVTLRFDLPQTAENAAGRNIQLQVSGNGGQATISLPEGTASSNQFGVSTEVKNVDGETLTTEERVGYYYMELSGLPAGNTQYQLELTGTGYKPFRTTVTLEHYSQHIIVGTGDGTFSLGDVNGDGAVDDKDLAAMSEQLGKVPVAAAFDLNGDGRVDVTDLSYIEHECGEAGEAQVLDTAALVSATLDTTGLSLTGSAEDLFRDEGTVTLAPKEANGELVIPIELAEPTEMSRIEITCPDGRGAIQTGQALVELEDGSQATVSFDHSLPDGVHAISRTVGQQVVTIDLGKKVAVKKVTITVTATAGGTDYATVSKVEFLKEIVPDSPKNDQVQSLTAVPGDGNVTLEWAPVRNITGYSIAYGTNGVLDRTAESTSTRAVISGLENMKTYQFQVTAVNGSWSGVPSAVVSATPEPSNVPGAPSNLGVVPADQSLRLSWGSTKDATFYQVFYREAGQSTFTQFGGNLSATSAVITGLTNGVTYQVAVKAGNRNGVGPYSATASGTPEREELVMPDLPEEDRIDNSLIESVVMADPSNVNQELCPNFTTMDVVDGDAATYWIARSWSYNSHFTYTFREPQDMNYAILVPYLDGNYKYALRTYTVTAKDSAGEVLLSETLYTAPGMDKDKNYLVLPFAPVKGVKELTISLNEREGNGCRVSISEFVFYRSDSLPEDISALFTDGSFTALQSGVTGEQLASLSQRLEAKADFYLDLARLRDELALAQALLDGQPGALGLVKQDFQSRSSGLDRHYGQSASSLQPLGVSARAGSVVAVYAQLPSDAPVYVVPTQFFGESGIWQGAAVKLANGRNYITVSQIGSLDAERGGPLYLTYAGEHPEQIKLQVRVDSNAFIVPILELSGWYDMDESTRMATIQGYVGQLADYVDRLSTSADLQTDVRNVTEISTPSVLLSIPADRALAGLKGVNRTAEEMAAAMYDDVLAWEDVLYVANQVQGIIPAAGARTDSDRYPMTTRQNIRYMRMFAGAFMYAAGSHVGVGYGSTSGLVCGRPVSETGAGNANSLFGWGIAHEIGHNMDKLGKAEITNNIYSLAVQAWDGSSMARPTRLTASNIWAGIFDKTSVGRPGTAGNVFVQLGMYWQLHLAYDLGDQPLDFYNRFFTDWKAGAYSGYTYEERVALTASQTAGRNLTQFFTRWGLSLGQEAKDLMAQYEAEPRALWYLNDDSYAWRLAGKTGFQGTVTVSAETVENKAILTIAGGDDSILGYEIRRDGQPIGFTTTDTYTDDLGPANNLTYTYSAVPVDKLGNMGDEAAANEVRVAWDTAIDASLYDLAQDGTTVTITMKEPAVSVTGIKIAGSAMTGSYTVEYKAEANDQDWTTIREGTLSGDTEVSYFTKPGAGADDTRIWTYDVSVLRISGVPDGAEVIPLDYPGDRVDFYQGATAGKLQSDYRYGEGEDDFIPAGTLVVLGTYRGDPAYNTVEIQARYDTTSEGQENGDGQSATLIERAMNGYALIFAEIPEDGKVGDTSDGFWIFVPDLEAEELLNQEAGAAGGPMEVRAVFYRYDEIDLSGTPRVTSMTLWISFPELEALPEIVLTGEDVQ